ncbi:MAG: DUF2231 domain-containing protein [Bacteroidia bacterium]
MPFHPQTVHFPIALLYTAFGLFVWHAVRPQDWVTRSANLLHVLGLVAMILSIFSGRQAESMVEVSAETADILQRHELLGYLSIWLFTGLWVWQFIRHGKMGSVGKWVFLALFAASLGAMSYGAHEGGVMVYQWGIGVSK